MKKIVILLMLIGMVGLTIIGCGTNDGKQTSSNNVETNNEVEEVAEQIEAEEDKQEKEETMNNEVQNDTDTQEGIEVAEHSGEAEKVLFSFFEAMTNQDIENAKQYVLYDDLGYPFGSIEGVIEYYLNNKLLDITKVEELSEDMKRIYVNIETPEEEMEDSYVLKKVNDAWYVAPQGVISRQKSIYTDEQVEDGKVGIYLKYIYHGFNGVDTYVLSLVNNTSEKLNIGFVNRGAVIYENNAGKGYIELDDNYVINPYNSEDMFFTVDSSEGPVKSIILKEVMLGLQAETSDVEVLMGEMVTE